MTKLRNVQFLRGVAALLVVGVHLGPLFGLRMPRGGVDLFFVISGFIMAYMAPKSPTNFIWRRVTRVVPLYWLMTLFIFTCAMIAPTLFKSTSAELGPLFKSLFFVPFAKEDAQVAQPLLYVGWTLNYEMFFYALFAVGIAFGRPAVFSSATLCALVLCGLVFAPTGVIGRFYTDPILLEFVFGMAVAALYRRRALSPLVLAGVPLLVVGDFVFAEIARPLSLGIPAALVLLAALRWERLGVGGMVGQAVGDASYSLYLTHPFIAAAAVALAPRGWEIPAAIAALGGCILTALWVHRHIEAPLTGRLNSFRRLRKTLTTSAPVL